jgi:hypothetical protein
VIIAVGCESDGSEEVGVHPLDCRERGVRNT